MGRDFKKSISQSLQIHPWIVGLPPFRFLFLLIFLSFSFSNGEPDCAPFPFNCGDIDKISYPFWKEGHPLDCSHPGFKLTCEDGTPKINIGSRKYRVNKIDYDNQKLRVADMDFIGKKCPQPSINATVDFSLFDYAPDDVNLTLYYNCPHSIDIPNYFPLSCLTNESNGIHAYYIIEPGPLHAAEDFRSCNVSVIPVLHELVVYGLRANLSAYVDVLKEGFNLKWTVHFGKCMDCVRSGGNCAYNSTNPTLLSTDVLLRRSTESGNMSQESDNQIK